MEHAQLKLSLLSNCQLGDLGLACRVSIFLSLMKTLPQGAGFPIWVRLPCILAPMLAKEESVLIEEEPKRGMMLDLVAVESLGIAPSGTLSACILEPDSKVMTIMTM